MSALLVFRSSPCRTDGIRCQHGALAPKLACVLSRLAGRNSCVMPMPSPMGQRRLAAWKWRLSSGSTPYLLGRVGDQQGCLKHSECHTLQHAAASQTVLRHLGMQHVPHSPLADRQQGGDAAHQDLRQLGPGAAGGCGCCPRSWWHGGRPRPAARQGSCKASRGRVGSRAGASRGAQRQRAVCGGGGERWWQPCWPRTQVTPASLALVELAGAGWQQGRRGSGLQAGRGEEQRAAGAFLAVAGCW